jgi:cytochrome c oxidase accessory protein FixG
MFDKDTLIVSYDAARGEPRGSRKRDAERGSGGQGDCIDCELCVQVCPTGIDIRNGLQYQCITCALCIDACDSVMDKMHYPRGLIRYTTEHQLNGEKHHWLRLKPVGYAVAILAMSTLLVYSLVTRSPVGFDVIRDRTRLFIETDTGTVENVYTLRIMNMDRTAHRFTLTVEGIEANLKADLPITLEAGEVRDLPVRLESHVDAAQGSKSIEFLLQAEDNPQLHKTRESRFIGPM